MPSHEEAEFGISEVGSPISLGGGWDPPRVPKGSGCCMAGPVGMPLQHCVDVRDSASKLAGGGKNLFYKN